MTLFDDRDANTPLFPTAPAAVTPEAIDAAMMRARRIRAEAALEMVTRLTSGTPAAQPRPNAPALSLGGRLAPAT